VSQMTSFRINPFSRHEGEHISGSVGSLSLTKMNGSVITVANLTEEIEILLPRTEVAEVNQTLLELANFSTVIINVTAPNISLVFKLDPSEETPLQLLLGFQDYPNDTNYEARIQLPQDEERYTWVLNPTEMTIEVGVYYLLVRPVVGAGVNSTNTSVFITTIAAHCLFWDETKANWSGDGCRVGPRTTTLVTQCLCTHLTFFGSSFFVMPNVVDVSRTAELFATFVNNPVVVCFVGAIILAYLLVVMWARRKDIQDAVKVKVTVLEDNDPLAEYRYLLSINTGHRRGASTSSQVMTLQGTEGEIEPHHLTDPEKPVFERGGLDMFLLTTPFSLGELQSIRLWHDNSGQHPSWYVNKVMVQDLETGQKWHFLCNSWLSVDLGERTLDKVFPVATEMDLKRFRYVTAKDFRDGHIWFSVISRPPSSNFTRVQRVSCCFSLLLCTMLTSIMFWGIPSDPSDSIIMFPINLLIVSIFRNARPREQKSESSSKQQSKIDPKKPVKMGRVSPNQPPHNNHKEITPDTVIKASPSLRFWPRIVPFLCHNGCGIMTFLIISFQDIKRIAQSLYKNLLEPHVSSCSVSGLHTRSSSPTEGNSGDSRKCSQKGLPWWFVFVGWFLVVSTSGVSAYFTMMYGLTYGKERSISWLISMVVSFFESLFITQPVKVRDGIKKTILVTFLFVFYDCIFMCILIKKIMEIVTKPQLKHLSTDDPDAIRIARRDSTCSFYQPPPPTDIEKMRNNMIKDKKNIIYLSLIKRSAYPHAYYLTQHIRQSFSNGISESMNHKDILNWAKSSLLSNLFGQYPGIPSLCIANIVYLFKVKNCLFIVPKYLTVPCCLLPFQWVRHLFSISLKDYHVVKGWTHGNFVVFIGAFQYRSEVQTVHLYQSTGGFHVFVMASEAIYFLFILYYMFVQGKLMKQQKWAYFRSKWNLLELAIIILSWSALSVFVKRTILGNRDIDCFSNRFASFYETATADAVLGYLTAFLVLLATIKLWHLLRLNPKLHMITSTLQRAWTDISGFIVVMTIMFLAYSIACNLMYGWRLYSYRTLLDAAQTIICLQLGIFNYDEVLDYNPVLGAFLIGSCIIFMTFVVLNLFISVILVAFNEEQLHPTEIVDLMLMKICSLLGIKCKKKQIGADASLTTASVIS
uniref:Polycystic kidney disease 1 like 2a n=1 Tax=Sinocyclocheilus grahami TaxID=75366 RepID=A0A672RTA5_SINGR